MKAEKKKFAGTFLCEDIESNKKLFYAWNQFRPIKIIKNDLCVAMYMRVLIGNKVYFISDSTTIDEFLNTCHLLNSTFFLQEDYDMTGLSKDTIDKYFEFIS